MLDPFDPAAHKRVAAWIAGETGARGDAMIELTLTSPDPEDLTLRQARLLGEADVLWLDGPVPPAILARARADATRLVWAGSAPSDEAKAGLTLLLHYRPA
jgi:uroporphyrin-III C-methyltransferase/precorrin-2 dehydrogenase/sirohydrochlorin ferrochelatase